MMRDETRKKVFRLQLGRQKQKQSDESEYESAQQGMSTHSSSDSVGELGDTPLSPLLFKTYEACTKESAVKAAGQRGSDAVYDTSEDMKIKAMHASPNRLSLDELPSFHMERVTDGTMGTESVMELVRTIEEDVELDVDSMNEYMDAYEKDNADISGLVRAAAGERDRKMEQMHDAIQTLMARMDESGESSELRKHVLFLDGVIRRLMQEQTVSKTDDMRQIQEMRRMLGRMEEDSKAVWRMYSSMQEQMNSLLDRVCSLEGSMFGSEEITPETNVYSIRSIDDRDVSRLLPQAHGDGIRKFLGMVVQRVGVPLVMAWIVQSVGRVAQRRHK
uniref:Uncharacterized protein n=1 Tax=Picochlorum oklahomense TaxID=249345 RepID=A0A7S1CX46_9CHLO